VQAIILAGGLGTRLRSAVPDLPKALAPIGDRPFLSYLLQDLQAGGFTSAILAVGYRHELIASSLGSAFGSLRLSYSVEESPLGTGGAIRNAATHCEQQNIFVLNGDTRCDFDYSAMHLAHSRAAARLTIGVATVADVSRFGTVHVQADIITGFAEKGMSGGGLINAGVYVMDRELLNDPLLPQAFSFERDFLPRQLPALLPRAFLARGQFIDIGVPEDYALAQTLFVRER
jgi:D-glycero-alpha-D-manno-heptose 1-phosphate guanylyltransferase